MVNRIHDGARLLAELRERGYEVVVEHLREEPVNYQELRLQEWQDTYPDRPLPAGWCLFGGQTLTWIVSSEDALADRAAEIAGVPLEKPLRESAVATGKATCRHDEQFNRRLGLTIALGRAYKQFQASSPDAEAFATTERSA